MGGRRTGLAAVCVAMAGALWAQAPSLSPAFHDRHLEVLPSGDTALVLRYLAPEIAGLSYGDVVPLLDAICAQAGLAAWRDSTPRPDEIVIVLMDRVVPRGSPDPDATQYISAYRSTTGESCEWQ